MLLYSGSEYTQFAKSVKELGTASMSRQGLTSELLNAQYSVAVGDYFVPCVARRFNLGFGVTEFMSLLTGVSDIRLFTKHVKSYNRFSMDGLSLDNSYGARMSGKVKSDYLSCQTLSGPGSQLTRCVDILKTDPSARYALASINCGVIDLWSKSQHVPCTVSIQWLIRSGCLNQVVTMRSNDVVKGVAYDVFMFGLLHQYMAEQLGLPVGSFVTNAASLHVYESDWDMINKAFDESSLPIDFSHGMGETMSSLKDKLFSTLTNYNLETGLPYEDLARQLSPGWLKDLVCASAVRWHPWAADLISLEHNRAIASWVWHFWYKSTTTNGAESST